MTQAKVKKAWTIESPLSNQLPQPMFTSSPHINSCRRSMSSSKMLAFCPVCANMLIVEEGPKCMRFACNTCPYIQNITRKISHKIYPKLKEVDDVLGGAAAWENVDSTDVTCPKCEHSRAFFMQIQTRSADEPMTTFYKCCNMACSHRWRDQG